MAGLLRLIDYSSTTLLYVSYVILGFGAGTVMVLMYGIQADNIDYVELVKGSRAEGAISSLQSFVAKAGGAIGGSVPAYVLAWTGYVANQEQTAAARTGIIASTLIVPSILGISAALVFLICYKIDTKTLNQTQEALAKLRSEKESR